MSQLGCRKDRPDPRDYKLTRMTAEMVREIPRSIDYTDRMSPVGNQMNEGVCVGFACVDGMKEYQDKEEYKKYIDLSVRYVYAGAKAIDGYPDEEGTEIRCAMKVLKDRGVCPESCWRYIPHVTGNPCKDADKLAEPYKIERYVRMETLQEMKESLVANGPFVAGVLVFKGMFNAPGGVVPMPGEDEDYVGGHAITIVGYDDDKKRFKFKNSWGHTWGEGGYGYLSYDYMEDFLMDAWSAKDKLHPKPSQPSWWERFVAWLKEVWDKFIRGSKNI